MKSISTGGRILLGWLALVLLQMIIGVLIPVRMTPPAHAFGWFLLTDLLIVSVLGFAAMRSEWRGLKLAVALAAIPFGIAVLNLIEGVVFLSKEGADWGRIAIQMLLSYALVAPVWAWIFGRNGHPSIQPENPLESGSLVKRAWKFLASDVTYLVLYFAAGLLIFPLVRDFYATQHVPPTATIVALQFLIRGPVFVLICVELVRMLHLPRPSGALMTGLAFTLLSGVAPLLVPNPFFPDFVRWVHFAEVTSSNFVFGAIVGWIWAPLREAVAATPEVKAA